MARQLPDGGGFASDGDPTQPHIAIHIDGGLELSDGELSLRDVMIKPFVDDLATAIRAFYDHRGQAGPFKHETDAARFAAAIAATEASTT
jgi:hypothetical protein